MSKKIIKFISSNEKQKPLMMNQVIPLGKGITYELFLKEKIKNDRQIKNNMNEKNTEEDNEEKNKEKENNNEDFDEEIDFNINFDDYKQIQKLISKNMVMK